MCQLPFVYVRLVDSTNRTVPGVFECAGRGETTIVNTSETVWYISEPNVFYYWTPEEDLAQNLTIQIFRAGLRALFGAEALKVTIEPGTTANVSYPFEQIILRQSAAVQGAWQTASLAVTTAEKQGKAYARSVVVGDSATRNALVTCVESGYAAGKTIAATTDEPANHLADALGLRGNYQKCASALDQAAQKEPVHGPTLTAEGLDETARQGSWIERVNVRIFEALKWGKAGLRYIHK